MDAGEVLFDFIKGKRKLGQMLNLFKYFCGTKKSVVNWDPIYISVFPTFRCNLNCNMCLTHSTKFINPFGQKPCDDMEFELFKNVLNRYKNALAVDLIGNGEPLLYKDLFKMIEYASNEMRMYTISGSNGVVLGEYVDKIIDCSLYQFIVSLNGHNSKEFNRMTGMPEKTFDTICENIIKLVKRRNLKKSNLKILVSIILDMENYKHLIDMIYFVETLGVDGILFFQFLSSPYEGFTAEERCLFSDDRNVLETFSKIDLFPSRIKRKISLPPLLDRAMDRNKYCSVPFYTLSVDGSGNVGCCCCQLLDFSENGKFNFEDDAWNNLHFREMRSRFIDPNLPLLEPCKQCYNNTGQSRLVSNPNPLLYKLRQTSGMKKVKD